MARRLLRFLGLFAASLALLPFALLSRACAGLGAGRAALRAGAAAQRLWGRALLATLGVEFACEGTPPPGTHLIVANHLSYLDIPLLATLFPGRFVAKSEIASWPVLGAMARSVGTIFLVQQRRRDVLRVDREMTRTLAAGVSVVLFPEGYSTRGAGVERLHSSLLECAARERIACLAVALHYETPNDPWAPASTVCWWGGMTFWRHAWTLLGLHGIRARVRVAEEPIVCGERKSLAAGLQRALRERFVPLRQEPIAPDYPWPELFAQPATGTSSGTGAGPLAGMVQRNPHE